MAPLEALDLDVLNWFQARHTPLWNVIIVNVTDLGYRYVVAVVLAVAAAVFALRRESRTALVLVLAGVAAGALTDGIKWTVRRPRPAVPPVAETSLLSPVLAALPVWSLPFSFPSGHALGSSAVYVTLALVVA
jgi:undecaprenyl-diphosphatase